MYKKLYTALFLGLITLVTTTLAAPTTVTITAPKNIKIGAEEVKNIKVQLATQVEKETLITLYLQCNTKNVRANANINVSILKNSTTSDVLVSIPIDGGLEESDVVDCSNVLTITVDPTNKDYTGSATVKVLSNQKQSITLQAKPKILDKKSPKQLAITAFYKNDPINKPIPIKLYLKDGHVEKKDMLIEAGKNSGNSGPFDLDLSNIASKSIIIIGEINDVNLRDEYEVQSVTIKILGNDSTNPNDPSSPYFPKTPSSKLDRLKEVMSKGWAGLKAGIERAKKVVEIAMELAEKAQEALNQAKNAVATAIGIPRAILDTILELCGGILPSNMKDMLEKCKGRLGVWEERLKGLNNNDYNRLQRELNAKNDSLNKALDTKISAENELENAENKLEEQRSELAGIWESLKDTKDGILLTISSSTIYKNGDTTLSVSLPDGIEALEDITIALRAVPDDVAAASNCIIIPEVITIKKGSQLAKFKVSASNETAVNRVLSIQGRSITPGFTVVKGTLTIDHSKVYVGQSVSPNGDGEGDVWRIWNIEQYPNEVAIFTSSGDLVYEVQNYNCQDLSSETCFKGCGNTGILKGKELPDGTYIYSVTATLDEEETDMPLIHHYYGTLTLKR